MLPSRKNLLLTWLIENLMVLPQLRVSFNTVNLREACPDFPANTPSILIANHSSWWDAHLLDMYGGRVLKRRLFLAVEDTQLLRYQFFRYAGAFSISRSNAHSALASIRHANDLLRAHADAMIMVFPQGEIRANDVRPLEFFHGALRMARGLPRVAFLPVALRIEFIGEQKPEAFISAAAPRLVDGTALDRASERVVADELQQSLTRELDQLRADVIDYKFESFSRILRGNSSINRLWDRVQGKAQIKKLGP